MTAHWFSKNLGDGLWAFSLIDQIRDAFEPLFGQAGRPADMAVFTRYESEGRLQCEVVAYFSPAAADVARALGAQACERPRRDNLDLLAGDAGCWPVLFPDFE
ncbi:MAG: hypothetical protein JWP93_935 [Polaromonas sp.]|nr:hypothetical protein [Polaromonas sp.]